MPKRLAMRIIGSVSLAADAPLREVLEAVLPITHDHERDSEQQAVLEVLNAAAKGRRAVVGLEKTLKQVSQRRVWQLIYAEDFESSGMECPQCGALFATPVPTCFYCTATLAKVHDVVERAIHRGLRDGAKIEVVKNAAAATLRREGGIAAFLRTRTRSAMM
jgi:peptide subunit release factor 1 (eRF1)